MTEEELDTAGALAVDEDHDERLEEMSLEERKERLKKVRWNVFLYLGVAAILFGFALFPMPFSADYDGFSKSAEKDIGLVWGVPVDGEDMFDVPMRLTVTATSPPTQSNINIAVYVIEQDDCTDFTLSEKMQDAKTGDSHSNQYQEAESRVLADGTYDFEFNIDPGQYCLIAEYIDGNGDKITSERAIAERGRQTLPNQFIEGSRSSLPGLSGFAFVGAQKHGAVLRKILEGENETTESVSCPKPVKIASLQGHQEPPVLRSVGPTWRSAHGPAGPPEPAASPDARIRKPQRNPPRNHPLRMREPTKPLKTATSSGKCQMELTTKRSMSKLTTEPMFLTKVEGGMPLQY